MLSTLPWALAALTCLVFILELTLSVLNVNESLKKRHVIPPDLADIIDAQTYHRIQKYTVSKSRFQMSVQLANSLAGIMVLVTGLPGIIHNILAEYLVSEPLQGIAFLTILMMMSAGLNLPFSLYRNFVLEGKFGFNRITPSLFISDLVKQGLLSLILFSALYTGLYAIHYYGGRFWWLWLWMFFSGFQIVLMMIYPVVIAPVFNKFTPLEEGPHKSAVMEISRKCGFSHRGIFVMDGSKRSTHGNAYFTGLGLFRRIVFYDNILKDMTPEEMSSILAHEIGHSKHGHIIKRVILQLIVFLGLFWLASLVFEFRELYAAFGFDSVSLSGFIVMSALALNPLSPVFSLISNIRSRKDEYQADNYAKKAIGSGKDLSSALKKLSKNSLSNLTPHPLYSRFHYSHPVLLERLKNLE
jgi:STE24 endopeptidase